MLVYHAYAERIRIVGVSYNLFLAIYENLSVIGTVEPEKYAHKRGFSGSVLPQERMDFSPFKAETYVVAGFNTGKALCDILHIYNKVFHKKLLYFSLCTFYNIIQYFSVCNKIRSEILLILKKVFKMNANKAICHIVAAADFDPRYFAPRKGDFIIAADAGLLHLKKLKISPDLVLGDFDSVGFVPAEGRVERIPVKKDFTDSHYALMRAKELGFDTVFIRLHRRRAF